MPLRQSVGPGRDGAAISFGNVRSNDKKFVDAATLSSVAVSRSTRVAVAAAVGPGLRWTLRLPVRAFGVFAQLVGLVVVAAIVVLVVVTLLALFAPL